ncbi:MAG TPA: 16S rRNA (cytidine(1402)-2'-O)-methyltransferase [Gammaproteobacteria bacterium]|jgi:16S rRNA (cytidine1402-2'-O)-methyltransferase|nr:16S rRNA (cytidine(1402)-2'-O)-methyltransferase [Gammaproteobacteria bacterium]
MLYIVATPIGNLGDMTPRAVDVLQRVDKIAAEDTRHSAPLLKHFSINKPVISLHDFNERERMEQVMEALRNGESIALISDAGTPLISDPGFHLVREAKAQGIPVSPVPGACALIAALSAAGLPTDKFIFEGFLPAKNEARKNYLHTLLREPRTIMFYEAPHRLQETLQSLLEVFGGNRKAVVARELTKMFESIIADDLQKLMDYYSQHEDECRGEIVILLAGAEAADNASVSVHPQDVLNILLQELPLKQAVSLASKITGARRNELYDAALAKKSGEDNN